MASSVTFQGRTTSIPGVLIAEDVSALSATSLGATGTVALIGSADGGVPYTALSGRSDIRAFPSATSLARAYPGGDLLEAANITFAASQDPAIGGGAQFVVPVKANPASQAAATLAGQGGPAVTVTAKAWGLAGNLISVAVAAGSSRGVKLTVSSGGLVEAGDNLGAEPVGSLRFAPHAGKGWQAMTAAVAGGAITATGSLTLNGRSSDLAASTLATPSTLAVQADLADAGKALTVYGLTAAGVAQSETLTLAAGPQSTSKAFASLLGASLSAGAQDVKVLAGDGTLLVELDGNDTAAGLARPGNLAVAGAAVQAKGSAAGEKVLLVGLDAAGNALLAAATLTTANQATAAFSVVQAVALGGVAPTHTVTLTAPAVAAGPGAAVSVAMAAGALRAVPGLVAKIDAQDASTLLAQLDPVAATDIVAGPLNLVSQVRAVVDWAASSQLVSIDAAAGSVGLPSPTTSPVYLSGGGERPATAADYQACLSLLRQVRVNTVVALTGDPAVAKAVDAHCALMCGAGQSERDAVVGVANAAGTDVPSFAEFQSGAAALNSRHTRAVGQAISVYSSANVLTEFPPAFLAAAVAGMQASAGVGVPLTHKTVNALSIRQSPSWSPMDDAQALLDAGCCIFEQKDNIGIRMVRNVTTYTADENLALQEASVNQVVDFVAYNTRLALEAFVGQRAFSGTVNSIAAKTTALMQDLIAQNIITAYQTPNITVIADVANIALAISPVLPINFVVANISLNLPSAFSNASAA